MSAHQKSKNFPSLLFQKLVIFDHIKLPTPPGKSWISFVKFPILESPGKWVWSCKVLEILVKCSGKSWNFLGYDVGSGHDAGADAEISSDFICIYEKSLGPGRSNCCLSLYLNRWKNASGVLESPGNFCN